MIDNTSKQFAVYVLSELLPRVEDLNGLSMQFISRLGSIVPGLNAAAFGDKRLTHDQWVNTVAPRIVDHYAESYRPEKLKTA